jgi:hypothetical protein
MTTMTMWRVVAGTVGIVCAVVLAFAIHGAMQRDAGAQVASQTAGLVIPAPVRLEHAEIAAELLVASRAPGGVGEAVRALAVVLRPHLAREERVALPLLGAIAPVARGESPPSPALVQALADTLRAELPEMLSEHRVIAAESIRLQAAAKAEGDRRAESLAKRLLVHAEMEEQVFYPAALLAADVGRRRAVASARW